MSQIKNFYFGLSNAILELRSFKYLYYNYSFNEISDGGARIRYYLLLQKDDVAQPKSEDGSTTFVRPEIKFDTVDIAVLDSIYTMWKNKKMIFTIDELVDIVFVCQNSHADEKYNAMVSNSLNKLLKIRITYGPMIKNVVMFMPAHPVSAICYQ